MCICLVVAACIVLLVLAAWLLDLLQAYCELLQATATVATANFDISLAERDLTGHGGLSVVVGVDAMPRVYMGTPPHHPHGVLPLLLQFVVIVQIAEGDAVQLLL
jgi:hypothetical protein